MIAIVESRADRASSHICEHLLDLADWEELEDDARPDADGGGTYYRTDGFELRRFDDLHLELVRPADAFDVDPDLLVFASRHSGDTGPLLTGHFTGNVGPAEFGGDDYSLADACPNALAALLEAFAEYAPGGRESESDSAVEHEYDVGLECTHHGPTDVGCPSLFAELGSDDEQWDDPAGAEAVARSILELEGVSPHRSRQVVGFGGTHYAPRFERIVRETPWAVGHIGSEWALEAMGDPRDHRDALERAFEASGADLAVVDGEWPELEAVVEDLGYRVVSETWLRQVDDRPLELAEGVETRLGTVDGGVRFGNARAEAFVVRELPTELVETAEGIDPERVRELLESRAIAFETRNGASRVGARAALPDAETDAELVDGLAEVLEAKYDAVRVESDVVVAEETAFDPSRARELGVPDGPKFGALASGSSVTVDGETIAPDDVTVERTHTFST